LGRLLSLPLLFLTVVHCVLLGTLHHVLLPLQTDEIQLNTSLLPSVVSCLQYERNMPALQEVLAQANAWLLEPLVVLR